MINLANDLTKLKTLLAVTLVGLLLLTFGWGPTLLASAQTPIPVGCDTEALIEAINTANSNGNGLDVIQLAPACTYPMRLHNRSDTYNALPVIIEPLRLEGQGAVLQGGVSFGPRHFHAKAPLTLVDVNLVSGVSSTVGGAIYAEAELTLMGVKVESSHAPSGGGVYAEESLTVSDGRFNDNHATQGDGGGLYANGPLVLADTDFSDNTATTSGRGLKAENGATINGGHFENNSARKIGGGLFVKGNLVLKEAAVIDNSAGTGGGVHNIQSNLTLKGNIFARNKAVRGAGLSLQTRDDENELVNNLWVDHSNSDDSPTSVIALFGDHEAEPRGRVVVFHNTIVSVVPSDDRGIETNLISSAVLRNNIITNQAVGVLVSNPDNVIADHNLYFGNTDDEVGPINSSNNFKANPRFIDPTGDNYHLQPDSPAIDVGDNAGIEIDLDGFTRPQGQSFDIGAYEFRITRETPPPSIETEAGRLTCLTCASTTGGTSDSPRLSGDGRIVAFQSTADFMGEGLSKDEWKVWQYHTATQELRRITRSGSSNVPSLNHDGTKIVYQHENYIQLFNATLQGDARYKTLTGSEGNGRSSDFPSISDDGRLIAFESTADFKGEGIPDNQREVWLYDATQTGDQTLTRLTRSGPGNISELPSLSGDGTKVAFDSSADFHGEGISGGQYNIWLYDTAQSPGQSLTRLTRSGPGRISSVPSLSADGTKVAFNSDADFHGEGIPNNHSEIWLVDIATETLSRITHSGPDRDSFSASLNGDGTKIAFASDADFHDEGIADNQREIWLYDATSKTLSRISDFGPGIDNLLPSLSADGRKIVFKSQADVRDGQIVRTEHYNIWLFEAKSDDPTPDPTATPDPDDPTPTPTPDPTATPDPDPTPESGDGFSVYLPLVVK